VLKASTTLHSKPSTHVVILKIRKSDIEVEPIGQAYFRATEETTQVAVIQALEPLISFVRNFGNLVEDVLVHMVETREMIPLLHSERVIAVESVKCSFGKFSNLQLAKGLLKPAGNLYLDVLLPRSWPSLATELLEKCLFQSRLLDGLEVVYRKKLVPFRGLESCRLFDLHTTWLERVYNSIVALEFYLAVRSLRDDFLVR
jgi:hypothetical protein